MPWSSVAAAIAGGRVTKRCCSNGSPTHCGPTAQPAIARGNVGDSRQRPWNMRIPNPFFFFSPQAPKGRSVLIPDVPFIERDLVSCKQHPHFILKRTPAVVLFLFSTKNREPWIRVAVEGELHAYAATVLNNAGCWCLALNGTADHVHALFSLSRVTTIAAVVEELKTSTSRWIKGKGRDYQGFHWQAGYGAFSVSQSNVKKVTEHIRQHQVHDYRGKRLRHGGSRGKSARVGASKSAESSIVAHPIQGRCRRNADIAPGYCRLGLRPTENAAPRCTGASRL